MPLILSGLRVTEGNPNDPDSLFRGKTYDDIGRDQELTDYLFRKHDPDGSKYGGDVQRLKSALLNDMTTTKSSILASVGSYLQSRGENTVERQQSNLAERLYESAPNRLFSPDATMGERAQALGAGLVGGLGYDAPLNLLMSPYILGRMGWAAMRGLTATGAAERAATSGAGQELLRKLSTDYVWREGERAALEQAARNQAWREVVKSNAKFEAGAGVVAGAAGGALEHGALENRGIDAGSMLGSVAEGAAMGGVFGGLVGGVTAIPGGRSVGRELVGETKAGDLARAGVQSIPDQAAQIVANRAAEAQRAAAPTAAIDTTVRDNAVGMAEAIHRMSTAVTELWDEAGGNRGASRLSRETLGEMSRTMARAAEADAMAAAKRAEADRLGMEQNNTQSLERAGELRREALTLERFGAFMRDPAMLDRLEDAPVADIEGTIAQALAVLNPRLAAMIDADLAPAAPTAASGPKTTPAAGQSTGEPPATGTQANGATQPGSEQPQAPSQPVDQPQAATKPVEQPTAADTQQPAASPESAAELDQLAPHLTDYDKTQLAEADEVLGAGGLDMAGALARIKADGVVDNLVAEIAKATGKKRGEVKTRLNKALAAVTRAKEAKAASDAQAAEQGVAPPPDSDTTSQPAQKVAAEPKAADEPPPTAEPSKQEAEPEATEQGMPDATGDDTYAAIVETVAADITAVKMVLGQVAKAADGAEGVAKAEELLGALRQDERLGPVFERITAEQLTTQAGRDRALASLDLAARKAVSWHYATALLPSMRDPFRVDDFEKLLGLMPGVPQSARRQIVEDFRADARAAVAQMVGRLGSFDAVRARLGDRAVDLLEGLDNPAPAGTRPKNALDAVDIRVVAEAAAEGLPDGTAAEIAKSLRQLAQELSVLNLAYDERLVRSVMHARAAEVAREKGRVVFDRNVRAEVAKATADAERAFWRDVDDDEFEDYLVSVRRVADADWRDMRVDTGALFANPIVDRLARDIHGNPLPYSFADEGMLVSGRKASKDISGKTVLGGAQNVLRPSNRYGFFGRLRAKVETGAGTSAAAKELGRAAVERANNRRMTIEIGGKKITLAMKEAVGRLMEEWPQRLERQRMARIFEAVRKVDAEEMTVDEFNVFREKEGRFLRPVRDSEVALARQIGEARERLRHAQELAQKQADDILEAMAAGGVDLSEKAAELQRRLRKVAQESGLSILNARRQLDSAADKAATGRPEKPKGDAVKVRLADGSEVELIPSRHITLRDDGTIMLFGEQVGTYVRGEGQGIDAKIGDEGKVVSVVTGIVGLGKAKGFLKSKKVRSVLEANRGQFTKAADEAADLPEGSTIPEGFTRTEEVEGAQAEIGGSDKAVVTDEMRARPATAFPTHPGHILVLHKKGSDVFIAVKPGTKALGDLIRDSDPGDVWLLGQLKAEQSTSGGLRYRVGDKVRAKANWVPYGRDPGKPSKSMQRVMDAAEANKDMAPELAVAQRRPITMKEAAKIKVTTPSGEAATLAEIVEGAASTDAFTRWFDTIAELDEHIAHLESIGELVSTFAPHGVIRSTASRRTSFHGLAQAVGAVSKTELSAALDVLRRLDTGSRGLPYFYSAGNETAYFGSSTNRIHIGTKEVPQVPVGTVVAHEVGHWAFVNLLTPGERAMYLRTLRKHYRPDGTLDKDSVRSASSLFSKTKGGDHVFHNTNELFAAHFQSYVIEVLRGGRFAAEERSFWQSMVTRVRQVLEWLIGDRGLIDPEVRALFERIMPVHPRETMYRYEDMLDTATGGRVKFGEAVDERHAAAMRNAEATRKIDELRGKLDAHLFSLDGSPTSGFAADLKDAALHMWGLLYGKKNVELTKGLRGALRETGQQQAHDAAGKPLYQRNEKNKIIKDASGRAVRVMERATIPGAVVHRRLFGHHGGGAIMAAIPEELRVVKSLDEARDGNSGELEALASRLVDGGNSAEFNAHYTRRFDELVAEGKTPDEADDLAWKSAEENYGPKDDDSAWGQFTAGMSVDAKADAAMRVVALQLRDLMTDAMEHLEFEVRRRGFLLQRNTLATSEAPKVKRTPAEEEAAEAVRKAAAASQTKRAEVPEPMEHGSEESREAAEREARHRKGDAASRGLPEGAPPEVSATVSRVTHRDADQQELMQGIGYDIFNLLGIERPTNADVARIVGDDLEDGVNPDAPAAHTESFKRLRDELRTITEALTNPSREAGTAVQMLAELMANARYPDMNAGRLSRAVLARMKRDSGRSLGDAEEEMLKAVDASDDMSEAVDRLVADVQHMLAGRAKTEEAKTIAPTANQTPTAALVQPMVTVDDGLHPFFARRSVEQAISLLDDGEVESLLARLGIQVLEGGPRETLRNSVVFMQSGEIGSGLRRSKKRIDLYDNPDSSLVLAQISEAMAGADRSVPSKLQMLYRELVEVDDEMAVLLATRPQDATETATRLLALGRHRQHVLSAMRNEHPRMANVSDAVRAVVVDANTVLDLRGDDPHVALAVLSMYSEFVGNPANKASKSVIAAADELRRAAQTGSGESVYLAIQALVPHGMLMKMLRNSGYTGIRSHSGLVLLPDARVTDFESALSTIDRVPSPNYAAMADAPLGGEVALRMAVDPNAKVDSLGLQQRALQKGAASEVAKFVSRLIPGRQLPEDGTEAFKTGRKFSMPVQLRENASRMRMAGIHWLANLVKPVEGTGFNEALHSALGRELSPVLKALDSVSGRSNSFKKWVDDLWRNGALHLDEVPQSRQEQRIAIAIRTGDLSGLTEAERRAAALIGDFFEGLRLQQQEAGIPVADVRGKNGSSPFYLPQRFNRLWIEHHPEEAIKRLAKWFEADGSDPEGALNSARRIVDRVRSDDEGDQFVGAASAASNTLYARVLNISGDDMRRLGLTDLFDNNLRSLVVGYANTALTRIESAKRFGVRGHGMDTYLEIGAKGREAAISALVDGAFGFRRNLGVMQTGATTQVTADFTQQLFGPLFRDVDRAAAAVDEVTRGLSGTDNLLARKEAAIAKLVSAYVATGQGGVRQFAKRAEAIVNGLSDFGPMGAAVHSAEAAFAKDFVGRLSGEAYAPRDWERRLTPAARGLMTFNSVTLLAMSTLASLSDAALPLVRSGNFRAWMKANGQLARHIAGMGPEGIQAARAIGVALDQSIHQAIQHVHGGRLGRFTTTFFLANGLTPWTNTMRSVAAVAGFESLKMAQAIVRREREAGRLESRAYMKNARYLRQLGAGSLIDAPALGSMSESVDNEVLRQAIHRFVSESVFQPGRNDIPLQFQDNPLMKLVFQLKTFPMMLGRAVKRAMAEAVAFESSASGKRVYVGDIKPLMFMATVGAGMAGVSQYARDIVSGRNEEADPYDSSTWRSHRDRRISRIVQELGFEDAEMDDETMDKVLGWYAESLLSLGAMGLVGDLFYQSARAIDNGSFGRERIMAQIFGPSVGTFQSALQAVEGVIDGNEESNAKERLAARAVASRIPLVASQRPVVEGIVDWIAGERE